MSNMTLLKKIESPDSVRIIDLRTGEIVSGYGLSSERNLEFLLNKAGIADACSTPYVEGGSDGARYKYSIKHSRSGRRCYVWTPSYPLEGSGCSVLSDPAHALSSNMKINKSSWQAKDVESMIDLLLEKLT